MSLEGLSLSTLGTRAVKPGTSQHAELVKAAIRMKGKTLSELSREHHYSEAYLRNALYRPIFQAEQIIADFLRIPAHLIWPDRYDIHGKPDYSGWSAQRQAHFIGLRKRAARG